MSGTKAPAKLSSRLLDMKFMRSGSPNPTPQEEEPKPASKKEPDSSDGSTPSGSDTLAKDPSSWSLSPDMMPKVRRDRHKIEEIGFSDIFQRPIEPAVGRLKYKNGKRVEFAEETDTQESPDFDTLAEKKAKEQRDKAKREKNLKKRKSQDQFGAPSKKARS